MEKASENMNLNVGDRIMFELLFETTIVDDEDKKRQVNL